MSSSASYRVPGALPAPSAAVDVPPRGSLQTYRDTIRRISPPWLRTGLGGSILYAVGAQLDALADGLVAGVKARFPGLGGSESLPLLGRERRIRRGRVESDQTYASRLVRWLDDHRYRGGPYALLAQLHAHYAPASFPIVLRYASGRRYTMSSDGAVVRDDDEAFVPPGDPALWARWWLTYEWPDPIPAPWTYGDGTRYGEGRVWGVGLSAVEVADLRLVPREWNAAHARGYVVLHHSSDTTAPIAVGDR